MTENIESNGHTNYRTEVGVADVLGALDTEHEPVLFEEDLIEELEEFPTEQEQVIDDLEALGLIAQIEIEGETAYFPVYAPPLADVTKRHIEVTKKKLRWSELVPLDEVEW